MRANLIIIGVPKAGTTSLFNKLASHPDICGSSIKETQYYRPLLEGRSPDPIEKYERYFSECTTERYRLDATPEYFYGGGNLIERIQSDLGDVRVILVLREPVSRTLSFFRFKKSRLHLPSDLSFDAYLEACRAIPEDQRLVRDNSPYMGLEGSHYDEYLPAWPAAFGDSLRIFFFDDLIADTPALLARIAEWLEIDPAGFAERDHDGGNNKTTYYRWAALHKLALAMGARAQGLYQTHPGLYNWILRTYYRINGTKPDEHPTEETLARLEKHFAPHNARLAAQLRESGISSLPDWLENSEIPVSVSTE